MDNPLRRPWEILAYRQLDRMLAAKSKSLWTVKPTDTALAAMRLMADKDIGLVLVMENDALVGVLSERDCVRRIVLAGKSAEATSVSDVMVSNVVKAKISDTFADCLKLMHDNRIRHLPVIANGAVVGIVSVRDLLGEAIAHYGRVIGELERERLTMLTSTA